MPTQSQPHLTRKTVVRFVTVRVYEYAAPTPPKPVIETTGEAVEELPPSVPGLRKAQPARLQLVSKTA